MGSSQSTGHKVIVVGLSGAGKTELISTLSKQRISIVSNSQGYIIKAIRHAGEIFSMWDLGGAFQEVGGALHYKGTKAILFVVDSTDTMHITKSCNSLTRLLQNKVLTGVPVVVLANKQDRVTALSSAEVNRSPLSIVELFSS